MQSSRIIFFTILLFVLFVPSVGFGQIDVLKNIFESRDALDDISGNDFPLDILWSAHTSIPFDYTGKALPVPGSAVTLHVLSPTKAVGGLEFEWTMVDSSSLTQGATHRGTGKNTFSFIAQPTFATFLHKIRVRVTDLATGESAIEVVEIPVRRPELVIMRESGGAYLPATQNTRATRGGEEELIARPFYFNAALETLRFQWFFGGEAIEGSEHDNVLELSLREDVPVGVKRTIEVTAENPHSGGIIPEVSSAQTFFIIQ